MRYSWICLCLLALSIQSLWAQQSMENDRLAARASNLLSYIAVDYGDAVDDDQILDTDLYRLQQHHATQALELVRQLPDKPGRSALERSIGALQEAIGHRDDADSVRRRANEIADRLAALYQMQRSPAQSLPAANLAAPLFQQRCARCHGSWGQGGGAVPDLRNATRMASFSLYDLYNTLDPIVDTVHSNRVDGDLDSRQRWALAVTVAAFAVKNQLPPSADLAERYPALVGLPGMAVTRPVELSNDARNALMWWRGHPHLVRSLEHPLTRAEGLLLLVETDYRGGDNAGAYHKLMLAYREGYQPLQQTIESRDRVLYSQLQAQWEKLRREVITAAPNTEVIASIQNLRALLATARARLEPTLGGGISYLWAALLFALALALGFSLWWGLRWRKRSRL
ncbi:c-type cytochrome [Microbulbifer variabilis]|uniref:c-type cytochrome n=1 Tax=Microbulbifer variabilis TaxID=266805 RepID=UPI001CFD482E|nr:cytochrome c [Microbulbifer variabilis]